MIWQIQENPAWLQTSETLTFLISWLNICVILRLESLLLMSQRFHFKSIICLSYLLGLRCALCLYHSRHKERLAVSLERKNLHQQNIIHLPLTFQLPPSVTTCSSLCPWLYQVLDEYPVLPLCLLTLQTLGNPVPWYHWYEYTYCCESLIIYSSVTICLRSIISGILGGQED